MLVFLILSILILCVDHYPSDERVSLSSTIINHLFTLALLIELVLKLSTQGAKSYLRTSHFNQFDCVIALLSLIDVIADTIFIKGEKDFNSLEITIMRAFRIIRLFKLARYWKNFELLLETLYKTIKNTASFTCLLFFVLFIYTLLGLELFAGKAKFSHEDQTVDSAHGKSPMLNFDSFLDSFTTVFILLTNDA